MEYIPGCFLLFHTGLICLKVSLSADKARSSLFWKKPQNYSLLHGDSCSCLLMGLYNAPGLSQKPFKSLKTLTTWLFFLLLQQWGGNVFLPSQQHEALCSPKASLAGAVALTWFSPNPHLHEDVEQPPHDPNISSERPQPSAEQSTLDYKPLRVLKHGQIHLWFWVWPAWIALQETFICTLSPLFELPLLRFRWFSLNTSKNPLQDFKEWETLT